MSESESSDGRAKPTFISGMAKRATRGNKLDKLLKGEKLVVDEFWKQNEYFGSRLGWQDVDDLDDDSEDYDFEKELGGKKDEDLDSFDEDFGDESGEEEEGDEEHQEDWEKRAEEAKKAVIRKGGKTKLHKKKGVDQYY